MSATPWPLGTDSGDALRRALRDYIKAWLSDPKYKSRLPRQFFHFLLEGEKESAGVVVRVVSQADPQPPWAFRHQNGVAVDDYHQIAVVVKADARTGGARSVSETFGALRALFATMESAPEYADLLVRGVYNCFESPEGFEVSGANNFDEAIFSSQTLSLKAKTTTLLS